MSTSIALFEGLHTMECAWERSRSDRRILESKYEKFTGLIHACELHIPYAIWNHARTMFREAQAYKGKKMLILCGDAVNMDLFSVYYKNSGDRSNPILELEMLCKFLKDAHKVYDHMLFISANHENRINKALSRWLPDVQQSDTMKKLVRGFSDIFRENGLGSAIVNAPFVCIGDALFAHMEDNSMIHGSTARKMVAYFKERVQTPIKMMFQAHTHVQSKLPIERIICVEIGALCNTQDYWRSGKMMGARKVTSIGYGRCIQRAGVSDVNASGFELCAWEDYL